MKRGIHDSKRPEPTKDGGEEPVGLGLGACDRFCELLESVRETLAIADVRPGDVRSDGSGIPVATDDEASKCNRTKKIMNLLAIFEKIVTFNHNYTGTPLNAQSSAVLDWEAFKDPALAHFIPTSTEILNETTKEAAWAEVKYLALVYKANLEKSRTPLLTLTFAYKLKDRSTIKITHFHKKRRGRPCENIAARLVVDICCLLVRYGCRHGVSHEHRTIDRCYAASLAELIQKMVGEKPRVEWVHMVEMANAVLSNTKKRKKVREWWLNLEGGQGAPGRTLPLDEARMWDCITSIYETDAPGVVDPHLK